MTNREPRLLIVVQQLVGLLCLGFVALIISANLGCAPKYFTRGDVIALVAIGLVDAILLLRASMGDDDTRRALGVTVSISAATLFLATVSIPALFAPLAIAGAFRLPRSRRLRSTLLLVIPAAIVATAGVIFIGYGFVSADQFRCP